MANWTHNTVEAITLAEISLEAARAELERCAEDLSPPRRGGQVMSAEPTINDLTPEQKAILLRLCDQAEREMRGLSQGLTHAAQVTRYVALTWSNKVRETITGSALVRKGLALQHPRQPRRFACTTEGYWLGDSLRVSKRQQDLDAARCPVCDRRSCSTSSNLCGYALAGTAHGDQNDDK